MNSVAIAFKFNLSVMSLCTCITIRLLSRCWVIVFRRYVFTRRSALNDRSEVELVAGMTEDKFNNGTHL